MRRLLSERRKLSTAALLSIAGILSACLAAGVLSYVSSNGRNASVKAGTEGNRLKAEKSPYLLLHANDAIDWYPWGDQAFETARQQNKPIFLSIGYSTCYWCHVMEREVFANREIDSILNKYFVCVIVDREERPDVDRVYMDALVAMTGSGGWPMSMFLTPDLKPFFGSTYLPPDQFSNLIKEVHRLWLNEPDKIRASSKQILEYLKRQTAVQTASVELNRSIFSNAFEQFHRDYDPLYGGFGKGTKFPQAAAIRFLLRYYHRYGDEAALQMALKTLREMAEGGIYDQLGGGYHRYSVDPKWRVPHFEKMLYDQAELIQAYLDAYQITGDGFYASIVRGTAAFVLRDLTSKEGGFYSAVDAESAPDPSQPERKQEGAYYLWTSDEIERQLGKKAGDVFDYAYGVEPRGNAVVDPMHSFESKNILYVAHSADEAAKRFQMAPAEVADILEKARSKLLAVRASRPRPMVDDKVIVSWNALMISSLSRAGRVLREPSYLVAAERAADLIMSRLYNHESGRLLRRYRAGDSRYDGTLEDYSYLAAALIDLYEATLDTGHLKDAVDLTNELISRFHDEKEGGFFASSTSDRSLLLRIKPGEDLDAPSGNSFAALDLLRLADITNEEDYRKTAEGTLDLFAGQMRQFPRAMPSMLGALEFHLDKPVEVIIAGDPKSPDTKAMFSEVYRRFIPDRVIMLADGGAAQRFLSGHNPLMSHFAVVDGKATAYVCENYACKLPTSSPSVLGKLLDERKPTK